MPKLYKKETSQSTIRWPIWITVGWLATILCYGAFSWHAVGGWPAPNTVGDFLAGAFSPVAFFWLILGYRQQGAELRLQVVELRRSVEQQEAMAKAALQSNEFLTQQDLRNRRAALLALQPVLRVRLLSEHATGDETKVGARFEISCLKHPAIELRIYRRIDSIARISLASGQTLAPGTSMPVLVEHLVGSPDREVCFAYLDIDGVSRMQIAKLYILPGILGNESIHLQDPQFVFPEDLELPGEQRH